MMRELLLTYINECFGSMQRAPAMWGSPESLELQALQLLEMRTLALRPNMFRQNHLETMRVYRSFVAHTLNEEPSQLLATLLEEQDKLDDMPTLIGALYDEVCRQLPEENLFETNDLVLDIALKPGSEPSFASVCSYYDRFQKALRSVAKRTNAKEKKGEETVADVTDYVVPELRVIREANATRLQVPLIPPKSEQTQMFDEPTGAEQKVHRAVNAVLKVATWADNEVPQMKDLHELFPVDVRRQVIAAETIKVLPGQGITEIRVGGRIVGNPVSLKAAQAQRLVPVLKEGVDPSEFKHAGIVIAVDLDQKWFRLKYSNGKTIRCWSTNSPKWLAMAVQAMSASTKLYVVGDEFRAPYRHAFVDTKDVMAA